MSLILNKAFITEPSVPVSKGDYLSFPQKFTSRCRSQEEDFAGAGGVSLGHSPQVRRAAAPEESFL